MMWTKMQSTVTRTVNTEAALCLLHSEVSKRNRVPVELYKYCQATFYGSPAKGGGSGEVREWQWRTIRACSCLDGGVGSDCSNLLKAIHMPGKVFGPGNCNKKSSEWLGYQCLLNAGILYITISINQFDVEWKAAWISDTVWRHISDDTIGRLL